MNAMTYHRVVRIGTFAQDELARSRSGLILAALSEAAYLLTARRTLLWMTSHSGSMHRRSLRLSGLLPRLSPGTPFRAEDGRIRLDRTGTIDFSRATTWRPTPRHSELPGHRRLMTDRLIRFCARACADYEPLGFGALIPDILRLTGACIQGHRLDHSDPALARAGPIVQAVAAAVFDSEPVRACQEAARLIGLGRGLTPSGDDFVGGLAFGLRNLVPEDQLPSLLPALRRLRHDAREHTHLIGNVLLRDLTFGYGPEPLHALMSASDWRRADDEGVCGTDLLQLGHSSGWDMLAGLACAALCGGQSPPAGEPAFGARPLVTLTVS